MIDKFYMRVYVWHALSWPYLATKIDLQQAMLQLTP